jgi:hypothetical protein
MAQAATPHILELALALEVEQLPIAGTLHQHTIEPQPFDGWLELIAAIETALTAARNDPPPIEQGGKP